MTITATIIIILIINIVIVDVVVVAIIFKVPPLTPTLNTEGTFHCCAAVSLLITNSIVYITLYFT